MKSIIRLFKAVPISKVGEKVPDDSLLKETVKRGFVFSPQVIFNYSETELFNLMKVVEEEIGLTGGQMNNSFHKSWKKVRDASIEQLVVEQIIHYFTTYGFERLGIYNEDSVYIPAETLKVPALKDDLPLIIIKGYTKDELKTKLLTLLSQGIALKEDTIKDVVDVALFVDLNESEIEQIRNKEVKCQLYVYLNKIPENPVEFLRLLIYNATSKTLLIKNKDIIEKIKTNDGLNILRLINQYEKERGLEKLSQIFLRFKPLFLAFKSNNQMKRKINKLRKLAIKNHVPMKGDYLNEVTARINNGEILDEVELYKELSNVNIFRRIRLAYALKYRTTNADSILYKIRNGKGYAKDFNFQYKSQAKRIYDCVLSSIVELVKKNVIGKTIYIPEYVTYTLPATEKQFTGDFPSGTCITVDKDMVVGVHWDNTGSGSGDYYWDNGRTDLDLSLLNITVGKIGWDGAYRTSNILFSGDMTNAPRPNGASELYHIERKETSSYIMILNYYNFNEKVKVPFKILVANVPSARLTQNYTVNPNHILSITKSEIDQKQKILGLLMITPEECKFYFSESSMGKSITARNKDHTENTRKYFINYFKNAITLNEVLELAGAKIVRDKQDAEIDLSPETLEKDKILQLLK